MQPHLLIVVEGGRVQDVLCDTAGIRVTVKEDEDDRPRTPHDAVLTPWPVTVMTPDRVDTLAHATSSPGEGDNVP